MVITARTLCTPSIRQVCRRPILNKIFIVSLLLVSITFSSISSLVHLSRSGQLSAGPSTSLLSSALQTNSSFSNDHNAIREFDRSRELGSLRRHWDDRDLIRTLSAPDLAQQQHLLKLQQEEQRQMNNFE